VNLSAKVYLRRLLSAIPLLNNYYLKIYMRVGLMNEKNLRGKLQHLGHRIDLHVSQNSAVPKELLAQLKLLLKEVKKRGMSIDAPLLWVLQLSVVASHNLHLHCEIVGEEVKVDAARGNAKFESVVVGRRSIREWTSDAVEIEDIKRILNVAKWAPSSCNRQLWQTLLVEEESDKKFLLDYFPNKFWVKAPILLLVVMNSEGYGRTEKHFAYLDGAAFIQNILLVLSDNKYGACWIGFKGWDTLGNMYLNKERYDRFYKHFQLERSQVPISIVAIGRPAITAKAPPRQSIENIVIRRPSHFCPSFSQESRKTVDRES
jgi:nitroreductase